MFDAPQSIHDLLNELTDAVKSILDANLIGIYLHGSLAMGCFNTEQSDLDVLIVVDRKMRVGTRQLFANIMLELNKKAPAKGFELSVITLEALHPFQHPTLFEFHFSNDWIKKFQNQQIDFTEEKTDPDLAAHLTIIKARGITLYGEPVDEVFPEIPATFYKDSIEGDAKEILNDITSNPVYNVLNLCRVWAYQTDQIITSKLEGAQWALKRSDAPQRQLIQQALTEYTSNAQSSWDLEALVSFGELMQKALSLTDDTDD